MATKITSSQRWKNGKTILNEEEIEQVIEVLFDQQ